jgi:hypothetical protein
MSEISNECDSVSPQAHNRDAPKGAETHNVYSEQQIPLSGTQCDRHDPRRHHQPEIAGEKIGDEGSG